MLSKPLAIGLLSIACVTAAAGGAYVAVRQNQPAVAPLDAAALPAEQAAVQPQAVQETEAVVTPAAAAPQADLVEEPAVEAPRPRLAPAQPAVRRAAAPRVRTGPAPRVDASDRPGPVREARPAAPVAAPVNPAASLPEATASPRSDVPAGAPEAVAVETTRRDPAPAAPLFEELVVSSASVMGLQIQTPVSSERARIEDRVEARVTRDVAVEGRTAIPAGTRVLGSVTLVERGGKVKERAQLGVRFHTLVFADGTELPIRTEAILREGESPTGDSTRKIGGAAVGGAILGAIIGGKKGAIVGGATGAAGGTAVVMAGDRNAATLPAGAVVTVRLSAPLTVAVEKR